MEHVFIHVEALCPGASLTVRRTTRNEFLPVSIPFPFLFFFFLPAFTSLLSALLSFLISILSPAFRSVILRLTYRHDPKVISAEDLKGFQAPKEVKNAATRVAGGRENSTCKCIPGSGT
jgi:hypothetical protein